MLTVSIILQIIGGITSIFLFICLMAFLAIYVPNWFNRITGRTWWSGVPKVKCPRCKGTGKIYESELSGK